MVRPRSQIRRRKDQVESATNKVTLFCYVPADVHRSLKIEAAQRRMSLGDLVVEALMSRIVRVTPPRQEPTK